MDEYSETESEFTTGDKRFGNPRERFLYWQPIFLKDKNSSKRQEFIESREESAKFLAKKIEEFLPKSVTDESKYWFKGSTVEKLMHYWLGMMFSNEWSCRIKKDTQFDAEADDMTRIVADRESDFLRDPDTAQEFAWAATEYFLKGGIGYICNRVDAGFIDYASESLRVVTEYVDNREIILDSSAVLPRDRQHQFRFRRISPQKVMDMHPGAGKIYPDSIVEDEVNYEGDEGGDSNTDYVEVEFKNIEKRLIYKIDQQLAAEIESSRYLHEGEFQNLVNMIRETIKVQPAREGEYAALLEKTEQIMAPEEVWYIDKLANSKALDEKPMELPYNRAIRKSGFSYEEVRYETLDDDSYCRDQLYFSKDELKLFIIFMTIVARSVIKYDGKKTFVSAELFAGDEKAAEDAKTQSGIIIVKSSTIKDKVYSVNMTDDLGLGILNVINWMNAYQENQHGIRGTISGEAVSAASPASLQAMVSSAASIQLVWRNKKFKDFVNRVIRGRMQLEREVGAIPENTPIEKYETNIETRSKAERMADVQMVKGLVDDGYFDVEELLEEAGKTGGKEYQQLIVDRQIGKMVRDNPQLMAIVNSVQNQNNNK